jgi:hypothetical protein
MPRRRARSRSRRPRWITPPPRCSTSVRSSRAWAGAAARFSASPTHSFSHCLAAVKASALMALAPLPVEAAPIVCMRCPHTGGHTRSRASCVHSHREALAHAHKALEVWESGPRPPATPPAAVPDDATADGSAEPAEPVVYAPHSSSQLALDNGLTLHVRSLWSEPAVAGSPPAPNRGIVAQKARTECEHECDHSSLLWRLRC